MKKYFIYHCPYYRYKDGRIGKIGVSTNPYFRVMQLGQKHKVEILEEHTDIFEVSIREKQLQEKYGYKVDCLPYYKTVNAHSDDNRSKGGKTGGPISASMPSNPINKKEKCPICGKKMNIINLYRWNHLPNCKRNKS